MGIKKEFYTGMGLTIDQLNGHLSYLSPFLEAIARRVLNKDLAVLEVGIGTGACCTFLEHLGYKNSFGIDIEPEIINRFNNTVRVLMGSTVRTQVADAFVLDDIKQQIGMDIGCVYHQGLFEHFSDKDIDTLIKHHLAITDMYFIFAVPIEGYIETGEVYDETEVHQPLQYWLDRIKPYKLYEYGVFGVDINKHQAFFVLSKGE